VNAIDTTSGGISSSTQPTGRPWLRKPTIKLQQTAMRAIIHHAASDRLDATHTSRWMF